MKCDVGNQQKEKNRKKIEKEREKRMTAKEKWERKMGNNKRGGKMKET